MKTPKETLPPNRRDVLYSVGSLVALGMLGCGGSTPTSPSSSAPTGSTNSSCTVTPALTEGPYFVDERLNRSDIRSDPASGVVSAGVPLSLIIRLTQVTAAGACVALQGALVDLWHCDALGVYSDVGSASGRKFLRGYQITDPGGVAQFTTIYPGWYMGRAVHLHFKVRTNPGAGSGLEFTSQMFFDESLTDTVYAQAPYSTRGRRDTLNTTDGIYRSGGTELVVPLSAAGTGYGGTFNIGVRV